MALAGGFSVDSSRTTIAGSWTYPAPMRLPNPSCCGHKYAGVPLGPIGWERHRAPSPRHRAPWPEARWPDSRLFGPPGDAPASSLTTPTFWWTSSVYQSGTANHYRPPLGQGYGCPVHYRGRTRLHHPGRRARSAPSDVRQIGPVTLRDILSSLRALAGGRYLAPRLTSLMFPIAPSPTWPTWHLTTVPSAGGTLGTFNTPGRQP